MKKILLLFTSVIWLTFNVDAQCVTNVDFNTWTEGGWAANGNWVVQGGGTQVHQTVNGNPTFFYSPFALMNARISGNFKTTNGDDDYMGFVFSFLDPLGQSDNFNCWLFDWKRGNQSGAQKGMSLNHLNGVIPVAAYNNTFWLHQNTPQFTCVQNNFGSAGWVQNFNHSFELFITFTRAMIYVDGNLVFDQPDCYWPGRFGFYNYSQQDCYYSNFQYALYVDFSVPNPQVCVGDTAQFHFINSCSGLNFVLTQYQTVTWNYGDGITETNNNPTINNVNSAHVYTQPGNYTVTLTVTDGQGCSDSATQSIVVKPLPVVGFANSPPCQASAVNFTDNTTGNPITNWYWNFGDNDSSLLQNPAHVYTTAGNYIVTLSATDNNNCSASLSRPITVYQPPVAGFTATTVCEGNATLFTDTSTGNPVLWNWDLGDGNYTSFQNGNHVYSTANNYNVTLIATNTFSCSDTITQPVTVNPKPGGLFNAPNVCFPNATQFNNQSTGAIITNGWSFGDGNFDTLQNPVHNYAAAGTYNVTLLVATNAGCADTITLPVTVYPKPLADFSVSPVCENSTSLFINNSSVSSGSISNYNWSFGDGNTAVQQNTSHVYASANSYNTTLIIQTNNGCADTISKTAVVNPNPVAAFTSANVCYPNAMLFNNQSTGNTINNWSFGDAQTSVQQSPSHNYALAGTYNAILIAVTANSCADTTTQPLVVNPKPSANFNVSAVCVGVVSSFTDNSAVSTGSLTGYSWSFGDGSTSSLQNPTHMYTSSGNYTVMLIAESDSTCMDTLSEVAVVNPLPIVNFTTAPVCLNQDNAFNNTSTISSGNISQWLWDFGDNQTSTQQSPLHVYAAQGTFTVVLVATSDNNCVDSISTAVDVFYKPVAAFTVSEECKGAGTVFTDNSTIGTGAVAQWNYTLGDGQISTQQNPIYTYANEGNYVITLIVTSDNGCTDTTVQTATVDPLPLVDFSATDVCLGLSTVFTNNSSIATGQIITWNWDFADGNSSALSAPAHSYAAFGNYIVKLVASSDKNCTDSLSKTITVFDIPVANAISTPACYHLDNGTATANTVNGTSPYSYNWNNGLTGAAITNLFAGNYDVTVTDTHNCTATATVDVTEPAVPLVVVSTPSAPFIKLNETILVTLNNSYNDVNASYVVSPGYGLSCTDCAQFEGQPYQTTAYNITVTDSKGCTGNGTVTITVDEAVPLFIPNVFTPNGDGANDEWGAFSQAVKQFTMQVFNRWGEKVFETDGIANLWDGTYQGKPLPNGVYVYTGNVVYLNNTTTKIKGSVTLMR